MAKERKAIENMWINLKTKQRVAESMAKYQAQLVAQGHTQQEGIN